MNREKYQNDRKALIEEAEALIESGDLEAYNDKAAEIRAFDDKFENEAKAVANLRALEGSAIGADIGTRLEAAGAKERGVVFARLGDETDADDPTNSIEYRKAFRNFVIKGTPMPSKFENADENTLTTDVTSAIPTILVNRIIEKMETIGMILPMVTPTSYAAGVNIPTSNVKPVATWVAEGAGSDRQKKPTGVITFTHHKLRCEISMSMEVSVMAISAFETAFVRQVSEAMVKAIEEKIISDDIGDTSPRGILAETPDEGQALEASKLSYQLLINAEAAIPQAYESGAVWVMSKKTFMGFVGIVDDVGQPVARVNYGIGGRPERTLLGRTVVLTGDYQPSFSTDLANGTIFTFIFNFSDYILNTIYNMGIQRKQDWDTEDMLTKAVMSVDGKVVDKHSLVTIAKNV